MSLRHVFASRVPSPCVPHSIHPSPRYAQELDIPGLRSRTVRRFLYLLFYVERVADIDIWRAVCAARDIPGWMREPRGLT